MRIKDSELSRKIAAAIIERGICITDLSCKPSERFKLYDNLISYHNINFSFENKDNEVLPKIEEVVHGVVNKEIEPDEETMNKINQIFDFFDTRDRKIDMKYSVSRTDFSGELQFDTANISTRKVVDKESVAKDLANTTGNSIINHGYYLGVYVDGSEDFTDVLSKAQHAIKAAPNISKKEDDRKDRERDYGVQSANQGRVAKTSQPLSDLLRPLTKTTEEITKADTREEDTIPDNTAMGSIAIEPWDLL